MLSVLIFSSYPQKVSRMIESLNSHFFPRFFAFRGLELLTNGTKHFTITLFRKPEVLAFIWYQS